MSSREEKRRVLQQLHDMGFQANEISVAIRENGYNLERCTDFLVSRQQNARPRLYVGMEVWIYSVDNEDWVPGNIVSITKQLVSIIFAGHDFRWLEKESDLFRIQDDKPEPFLLSNVDPVSPHSQQNSNEYGNGNNNQDPNVVGGAQMGNKNSNPVNPDLIQSVSHRDPNGGGGAGNPPPQGGYQPPGSDEVDYHVRFTESVLGLELYSDEDGYNCIVGRCVSNIARANVTPGSQIVQVNDRWLANFRFEEIRDAVKQAAKSPPLNVTFRIKKSILGGLPNKNINIQNPEVAPYTSPADNNGNNSGHRKLPVDGRSAVQVPADALSANSVSRMEEKEHMPLNHQQSPLNYQNEDDPFEPHMTVEQAERLQIGDFIDNRDDVGRFLLASIVEKSGTKVKIHYEGWNSKWDKWYDYTNELRKFARARSISRKPNTRFPQLKIRDYVDINPLERHPGWRPGQIRRMDKYSGQSQIVYKEDGQEFLYWAHLNNPEEIAPFMTKSAETIAKQQQQAHQNHQQQPPHQQQQQQQYVAAMQSDPNYDQYNNGSPNDMGQYNQDINNGYNNGMGPNHNHKESVTFSQTSSKVRRALPATLQGRSLPPKPPRKSKVDQE